MTAVLRKLGAQHAARMHEIMTVDTQHPWSVRDWLAHFSEEERFIFPIMLQHGMRDHVLKLARDHASFREQFRRSGTADKALLEAHAELEDRLVLQLEPYIL